MFLKDLSLALASLYVIGITVSFQALTLISGNLASAKSLKQGSGWVLFSVTISHAESATHITPRTHI